MINPGNMGHTDTNELSEIFSVDKGCFEMLSQFLRLIKNIKKKDSIISLGVQNNKS